MKIRTEGSNPSPSAMQNTQTVSPPVEKTQEARFAFGENWSRFLALVDETRINEAVRSMQQLLGVDTLAGKRFLDIGSGSGLFSLAAVRLGATVHSFDYDANSVACGQELKRRYAPKAGWTIEQGSVLDQAYLERIGNFDVVYSWGVLHHTGDMWRAIGNAAARVKPGGLLAIAIYNDQGVRSLGWLWAKRVYNKLPAALRPPYVALFWPTLWGPTMIKDILKGRPLHSWRHYQSNRGMSPWRDMVDWVGGLPFEVATPNALIEFARKRGFELVSLDRRDGLGCNELVFRTIQQ
jgi:2-polyprenyl-3-methyl-5-hydroxy-6-metoxy-1,4-benzoquinol methylase